MVTFKRGDMGNKFIGLDGGGGGWFVSGKVYIINREGEGALICNTAWDMLWVMGDEGGGGWFSVDALTCNMDLIGYAVFSRMWGFDRFACPFGVGRSNDTNVLPLGGLPCVHAMQCETRVCIVSPDRAAVFFEPCSVKADCLSSNPINSH